MSTNKLHRISMLGMTVAAMGKDVIIALLSWMIKNSLKGRSIRSIFPGICQVGSGSCRAA